MKKKFKNFSTIFILTLVSALLFTGCSSSQREHVNENVPGTEKGLDLEQPNDLTGDRNINKGNMNNSDPNIVNDGDLNARDLDNDSMMRRSKDIATKLSELDKVNNANVLITGNTALVGIDIPKDSSDENTKKIKDEVVNKVKDLDNGIDNVVVTADADLITRMKNLGTDIESGKPISGLGNEIEEIIKRITPNM